MSLDSIQILNISNVNAQGMTVLNDGKLLELIMCYPFLYNPRVKAFNDPDYAKWAWKRINASFNRSYEDDPSAAFSVGDLANRWEALKPLVRCLRNAFDLEAIPPSLRQSVLKICTQLDDQSTHRPDKSNILSQNFLLQQVDKVAKLPLEKRLSLEREVLDVILNEELTAKSTVKLNQSERQKISKETEDFLCDIGFRQVFELGYIQEQKNFVMNDSSQLLKNINDKVNRWIPLTEIHKHIKPCYVHIKRCNIDDYVPLAKLS